MNNHRGNFLAAAAAAGAILILGAVACYLLAQAGPEALAATSRALLTTALIGVPVAAVVTMHLTLTGRPHPDSQSRDSGGGDGRGGGHGRGNDHPQAPDPTPATDDLEAELFRIIDDERLRGTRRSSTC